jgi:hypothetical protein
MKGEEEHGMSKPSPFMGEGLGEGGKTGTLPSRMILKKFMNAGL